VRFPKRIKYRGRVLATIYGRCKGRDSYRVAWQVAGQRHMASFPSYSLAKRHADSLVKDLAKGSQVTALQPAQARDALAALELLRGFQHQTGRNVSLLRVVSKWVDVSGKLNGRAVADAIDGFLSTVANVTRKDISEAVEEFIKADEPRTKAGEGQRAQLSSEYARIRGLRLRKFATAFPATAVCDLTKNHLDAFINSFGESSAKSRNHHRAGIKQFLQWSVRKDYLPTTNRLSEADAMRPEHANNGATEFYSAIDFGALLEKADKRLLPIIAIGGLAGLRTAELLRLDWEDVWRVAGHIEVTAGKAKTRQRRLVEVCPVLAAWLDALTLRPFWRLVIAGNDDEAGLQICPALSPSLVDKLLILRARRAEGLPETNEEQDAWAKTICAELPAFAHWLLRYQTPATFELSPRTRLPIFQHPDIVSALHDLQPEMRLLELIDGLDLIGQDAPLWEGTATEFEQAMRSKDNGRILDRIFTSGTAAGRMLAELARIAPHRVEKTNRANHSFYRIFHAEPTHSESISKSTHRPPPAPTILNAG